jgi:hypothetical protein
MQKKSGKFIKITKEALEARGYHKGEVSQIIEGVQNSIPERITSSLKNGSKPAISTANKKRKRKSSDTWPPPRTGAHKKLDSEFSAFTPEQASEICKSLNLDPGSRAASDMIKEIEGQARWYLAYRATHDKSTKNKTGQGESISLAQLRAELQELTDLRSALFRAEQIISHLDPETLSLLDLSFMKILPNASPGLTWQEKRVKDLQILSSELQIAEPKLKKLPKTRIPSNHWKYLIANLATIFKVATRGKKLPGLGNTKFEAFLKHVFNVIDPHELQMLTEEALRSRIRTVLKLITPPKRKRKKLRTTL